MSRREKAPSSIATLLGDSDPTLQRLMRSAAELKSFQRAWSDIIPGTASDYIRPAFYRDGRLTVWVQSPVWANWIRHRQQSVISRVLEQDLPEVRSLVIRLSPQKHVHSARARRRPGEQTSQIIRQTTRTIEDPALRDSIERLLRTLKNSD